MKILRVISSGAAEGGAENGVVAIQPFLEVRGYTIKILAGTTRPDMVQFSDYRFNVPPHSLIGKLMYTFNPSAFFTLRKVLREYQPDVVHLHTLGSASPGILFALKQYPTVATVHGPEGYTKELLLWCLPKTDFKNGEYAFENLTLIGRLRYWYYRYVNYPLFRLGFRYIDRFITISTYIYDVMARQGTPSIYIPNGVRMLPFVPLSRDSVSHRIVFAGRLEKFKGVEYVIRAMKAIIARYPDATFHIAGSGKESDELKMLVHTEGLDHAVQFLGYLTAPALEELYASASVVVVPSIWPEVCSRSGIEAMSVGRPIVGSNVGGSPDWLLDGVTGRLVPPRDASSIADAVIDLFDHPDALIEMGNNARAKAMEYDVALHAARIDKVYTELVYSKK